MIACGPLRITLRASLGLLLVITVWSRPADGQPTVKQAFGLVPMQKDVEIDQPADLNQLDGYQMDAEQDGKRRAWVVRGPNGNLLRRFSDTNGDNKIDQWCYFHRGVEVYRDIDGDFNEKADQYRWFATGGLRWGLDRDEDGRIDDWKWISPEETTAEVVRAIRDRDADRFATLLVRDEEATQLGLSDEFTQQLTSQTADARSNFDGWANGLTQINDSTAWVDFSSPPPGVIPGGGTHGDEDLVVYENVIAMVETDGKHHQLPIGTLIRVDERWRLLALPDGENEGFFYRSSGPATLPVASSQREVTDKVQELVQSLEKLDNQLSTDSSNPQAARRIYERRCAVLRQLAAESTGEDRDLWLMQLVDSVVSTSHNDEGVETLKQLVNEIKGGTENDDVIGQAMFAYLTAEYSMQLQNPNANLAKIQDKWIRDLKDFVKKYGTARPAAEAMLQLAISEEFAGEDKQAIAWYSNIVRGFADTDMADKARGAAKRLNSVGKPLELRGRGLSGSPVDLAELRGNLVLVHYWATWCDPCKQDMQQLKKLLATYRKQRFAIVGVNLDDAPREAVRYVQAERLPWPQIHDDGGLESDQAKQMGVFTLPVMLLVDEKGKVINRQVTVAELESILKKRRAR